ncbi:MAG: fused MFS/spermidine synthase [Bacillota bacterium]
MPNEEHKWLIEKTSPTTAHMFGIERYVKNYKTAYQDVEIAESSFFGRLLILDDKIQSAEHDEYIYHEALVHPAMLMCPSPRRVLFTGGGEGATLREIFKHPSVENVVMVDLDQEVVELCKEYLQYWHQGSFEDKRLELLFMDARQYLEETDQVFDVIISDIPEPVEEGPAVKLFTRQYYALIKRRLAAGGTVSLQAGDCALPFIEVHSAINHTIRQEMPFVHSYKAFIPSFNTEWGFILAAPYDKILANEEIFNDKIMERNLELYFFDGETSAGMFLLPKDIRERLANEKAVLDDDNLLTVY